MSHTPNTKIKKIHEAWARANGYRPQASSLKQAIQETVPHNDIEEAQASSLKHQANPSKSRKPQAPSSKRQA